MLAAAPKGIKRSKAKIAPDKMMQEGKHHFERGDLSDSLVGEESVSMETSRKNVNLAEGSPQQEHRTLLND